MASSMALQPSGNATNFLNGGPQGSVTLDFLTMEVMHHYTNFACHTVYDKQDTIASEVWQTKCPSLAFSTTSSILLHSMLAFSALHLHHLHSNSNSEQQIQQSTDKYALFAATHFSHAMRLVSCNNASQDCDIVVKFLSYVLIMRYGFATTSLYTKTEWIYQLYCIRPWKNLEWFEYGRDLAPFIQTLTTKHKSVSDLMDMDNAIVPFPPSLSTFHLPACGAPDVGEVADPRVSRVYEEAIVSLRRVFAASMLPHCQSYAASIWLAGIPDEFLTLLWERRPRALVLAAHHCAIMQQMSGPWWSRKRWEDELHRITAVLDKRWHCWLDWSRPATVPQRDVVVQDDENWTHDHFAGERSE